VFSHEFELNVLLWLWFFMDMNSVLVLIGKGKRSPASGSAVYAHVDDVWACTWRSETTATSAVTVASRHARSSCTWSQNAITWMTRDAMKAWKNWIQTHWISVDLSWCANRSVGSLRKAANKIDYHCYTRWFVRNLEGRRPIVKKKIRSTMGDQTDPHLLSFHRCRRTGGWRGQGPKYNKFTTSDKDGGAITYQRNFSILQLKERSVVEFDKPMNALIHCMQRWGDQCWAADLWTQLRFYVSKSPSNRVGWWGVLCLHGLLLAPESSTAQWQERFLPGPNRSHSRTLAQSCSPRRCDQLMHLPRRRFHMLLLGVCSCGLGTFYGVFSPWSIANRRTWLLAAQSCARRIWRRGLDVHRVDDARQMKPDISLPFPSWKKLERWSGELSKLTSSSNFSSSWSSIVSCATVSRYWSRPNQGEKELQVTNQETKKRNKEH
jgi:hypothetical protein